MKIITICGSMKFIENMLEMALKLELDGNCCLLPIYTNNALSESEIMCLNKMHQEKIKISDAIFVVNVNGYIGNSTKKEIEFAKSLGKEIIYYSDLRNEEK